MDPSRMPASLAPPQQARQLSSSELLSMHSKSGRLFVHDKVVDPKDDHARPAHSCRSSCDQVLYWFYPTAKLIALAVPCVLTSFSMQYLLFCLVLACRNPRGGAFSMLPVRAGGLKL